MIAKLFMKFFVWFWAILYGTMVLFGLTIQIFKKGYGKAFNKTKRERPACLQDKNLGMHGFLYLEDVKIHYVINGPEDKPLMLFVHGFPEFWFSWRNQLLEFGKDYRCVAIDMRGYGESDKPSGIEKYQMKYLMKDLQQVIEALGYKSCILVSHDWGGAVAWSFARFYPDYVDKLIVMNCPAGPVFQKVLRTVRKQFKLSWYIFFFQLPYLPEIMMGMNDFDAFNMYKERKSNTGQTVFFNPLSDEEVEAYKYTYSQPGALTPPINFYRAALQYEPAKYDMNYTVPAMLIWGIEDMALCKEIPALTEQLNPAIVVKRIENCGHFVQMDAPERTNQLMREWLS